jgi:hypothetical protein
MPPSRPHLFLISYNLPSLLPGKSFKLKGKTVCICEAPFLIEICIPTVLRIRDVYPGSRIPDPDFYPSWIPDLGSRIPDPKTATKERGEKKLVVIPFHVATNFTQL